MATDVASRGLDIPDVQLVIQDGPPTESPVYVHRTGRTGRAGKTGKAVLLYSARSRMDIGSLARELNIPLQYRAPPAIQVSTAAHRAGEGGREGEAAHYQIPSLFLVE